MRASGLGLHDVRPVVDRRSGIGNLPLFLVPILLAVVFLPAFAAGAASGLDFDEFRLPSGNQPIAITSGPDGNLWFTENAAIGRITPTGEITEFPGVEPSVSPKAITSGPDGNLWFTEKAAIGRITPSGVFTAFSVPNGFKPYAIAKGPDGNLWFTTAESSGEIGRITPSGEVVVFSGPGEGRLPQELAAGPDGNVWFTERGGATAFVGRITPSGGITEFPVGGASDETAGIALGLDGNMWFTERGPGRVGLITPDGSVTEFGQPDPASGPGPIVAGPDGTMWFTAHSGSHPGATQIKRITPQGRVTWFLGGGVGSIPSLAVGPDDNIWFTIGPRFYPAQSGGYTIGRLTTSHAPGAIEIPGDRGVARRRWVKLRIKCQGSDRNSPCIGQLRLSVITKRRTGSPLIARSTYKLPAGGTKVLHLRLTRVGLRIFARHTHLRVDASASAFDLLDRTSQSVVLRRRGRPLLPG